MPPPVHPRDMKVPALAPNSVLGPADTRTLEIAAEILRERTMSLDPDESPPTKRLVVRVLVFTTAAAASLLVFRNEVRWMLGLG